MTVRDHIRAVLGREKEEEKGREKERSEEKEKREEEGVDVRWQQPCFTWPIASPLSDTRPAPHAGRYNFLTDGPRVPRRDAAVPGPIASQISTVAIRMPFKGIETLCLRCELSE